MEKLKEKYQSAQAALQTLQEIQDEEYSDVLRDAAIQRFEYSFEICWKMLQAYLNEIEGIIANSPKSAFREALSVGVFDKEETELALEMTDHRNLTTHTYHEEIAQLIFDRLPTYQQLLTNLLQRIELHV